MAVGSLAGSGIVRVKSVIARQMAGGGGGASGCVKAESWASGNNCEEVDGEIHARQDKNEHTSTAERMERADDQVATGFARHGERPWVRQGRADGSESEVRAPEHQSSTRAQQHPQPDEQK